MTREEAVEVLENGKWWEALVPATLIEGKIAEDKLQEALDLAISALKGPTREQVEKMRGEWRPYVPRALGAEDAQYRCAGCGLTADAKAPFCPQCGAPMTEEAVDILAKRLEEALGGCQT